MKSKKKKLIVFDLDFTLWNCGGGWCDTSRPPYKKEDNKIYDSNKDVMRLYPDSIHILEDLFHSGHILAIASRTHEPEWAMDLLEMHGILPYFKYLEIYPGSKLQHFKSLNKRSGIAFSDMYFFDDEMRNIEEVGMLGVNVFPVEDGVRYEEVIGCIQQGVNNEILSL